MYLPLMTILVSYFRFVSLLICIAGLVGISTSCKTEDIEPVVTISIDSLRNGRISENGGIAIVRANLNGATTKAVTISLSFAGTATSNIDYTASGFQIIIPAGDTTGALKITALADSIIEGDRSIAVTLSGVANATNLSFGTQTVLISDDDSDSDNDGISDASDLCPQDSGGVVSNGCPAGFGLVLNEVLYDPSNAALAGDANGDGTYNQTQDEFIELYNSSQAAQDISGYTFSDFDIGSGLATVRYTFPANTILLAGKGLVLFGGGTPTGSFGGSKVLVVAAAEGLNMGNAGEKLVIKDRAGNTLIIFDTDALSDNPNESYTRSPDITGAFLQHSDVVAGVLFSPGTRTNGSSF